MKHVYAPILTALLAFLLIGTPAFADDTQSFESFFDDAAADFASPEGSAPTPSLSVTGLAKMQTRVWTDEDNEENAGLDDDRAVGVLPSLRLDFSYEGASGELEGKLLLDTGTLVTNPEDILEELTYRAYLGDFVLSAGKSKIVWGRGDKVHVLDLFNADDYSDFLIPDYIDRRIAEPMVALTWNMPDNMSLSAVWTPTMTPDRIPTSGVWEPDSAKALVSCGKSYVTYLAKTRYAEAYAFTYEHTPKTDDNTEAATAAAVLAGLSAVSEVKDTYGSGDALLPDTNSLKYGQYGMRWTGTFGPVDVGAEYYLGHYKTPSLKKITADAATGSVTDFELGYDRLQAFGIDAAGAAGPFNLRGEAAYYLTDDTAGDDPAVHNNSLQWLGGFDVNLPYNELNLNVQLVGSYILGNDGIAGETDVDWNSAGTWTNDKLIVNLSDSYDHEKIKPSVAAVWGIERQDFILMPKVECTLEDGFAVAASGAWFVSGDDGEFASYEHNGYVQMTASYSF